MQGISLRISEEVPILEAISEKEQLLKLIH